MNQLLTRLRDNPWTTLVSLPRNDVTLAQAARRGGAQGLKIHLNVDHHASGTHFGSWQEEKTEIARILDVAKSGGTQPIPVGIVPGGGGIFATPDEFGDMAACGLDFFDAYPADAPAWTLGQTDLDVMLAAYAGGSSSEIAALEELGMTMCEASIVAQSDYGQALNARDVACYRELAHVLSAPIIVPSQKAITPADLPALRASGVRGILIGAIVVGREADSIEGATRAFCIAD